MQDNIIALKVVERLVGLNALTDLEVRTVILQQTYQGIITDLLVCE